jgi:hypothetical protein
LTRLDVNSNPVMGRRRRRAVRVALVGLIVMAGLVGLVGCDKAEPARGAVALEGPRSAPSLAAAEAAVASAPPLRGQGVGLGPEAVALAVCPYVQGPLLEWLLLEDFAQWLTAADVEVALRVQERVVATADVAHDAGVRRFVAKGTRCEVLALRAAADGRQQVRLRQRRPVAVEPQRPFGLDTRAPRAQQVAQWEGAVAAASQGAAPEPEAVVELTLTQEAGRWRLDAGLAAKVWQPLLRQEALGGLPGLVAQRRWAAAAQAVAVVCAAQSLVEVCAQWQAEVTQGAAQAARTEPLRASLRVEVAGAPVNAHGRSLLPLRVTAPAQGPALASVWVEVKAFDAFGRALPFAHVCEVKPGARGFADATCALPGLPAAAARWEAAAVEAR